MKNIRRVSKLRCPLCESEKGHRIYKLCDNFKIMGESFPESPAYIARCDSCGLLYTDTEATQQDFLSYYINNAVAPKYYDMFGKKDTDEYYQHLLDLISPYINSRSKILDVAGSWGEFGVFLKNNGFKDVMVLDPNETCIEGAKEKELAVFLSDSTDMSKISDNSMDMIILNHTMEHILDIKSTMNEIERILKGDGYIFIELPDVEGYSEEDTAPFNFLTYEHVVHMSMNDLENLCSIYGYEMLEKGHYYKKVSNYPSIYAILKKGQVHKVRFSDKSEECMKQYIEKSRDVLEKFLKPLRESGEELILWGIGASTTILLEAFEGCNVKALIDRNPSRQGLGFVLNSKNYFVASPDTVGDGTIVILSIPYYDSIARQISEMGIKNKIVSLR